MKNRLFPLVLVSAAALLAACSESSNTAGGTGAGAGGAGPAGTVVSPATAQAFKVKNAFANVFNDTRTGPFTATGVMAGVAVAGSGTLTQAAPTPIVFEGVAALVKQSSILGSATGMVNGMPVAYPIAMVALDYLDTSYVPLGQQIPTTVYSVVTGAVTIPDKVDFNTSGPLFTYNNYTDSAKLVPLGTTAMSYAVLPDTATTALLKLIATQKDLANATLGTSTTTYRMTLDGLVTRLSDTVVSGANTLTITY